MNERGNDLERDELVARLAEAFIAEQDAETGLRAAACGDLAEKYGRRRLLERARAYAAAFEARQRLKDGSDTATLYGNGFVMGEALGIADAERAARWDRREARRKAEEQIAAEGLGQLERAAGAK